MKKLLALLLALTMLLTLCACGGNPEIGRASCRERVSKSV